MLMPDCRLPRANRACHAASGAWPVSHPEDHGAFPHDQKGGSIGNCFLVAIMIEGSLEV